MPPAGEIVSPLLIRRAVGSITGAQEAPTIGVIVPYPDHMAGMAITAAPEERNPDVTPVVGAGIGIGKGVFRVPEVWLINDGFGVFLQTHYPHVGEWAR